MKRKKKAPSRRAALSFPPFFRTLCAPWLRTPLYCCAERAARDTKFTAEFQAVLTFGETALREAVTEYVIHYHGERAHQGLDHQILEPGPEAGQQAGEMVCRERLGGLLKYYHRQAA